MDLYTAQMPCSSISTKQFWTGPNYYGPIQNILEWTNEIIKLHPTSSLPTWKTLKKIKIGWVL